MCLPPRRPDRYGRVLAHARDEALASAAPALGTEHLLLGLVREERATRGRVLAAVDPDDLRAQLPRRRPTSRPRGAVFSRRATAVLGSARRLADRRGAGEVGADHLLVALLGDPDCAAVAVLERLGFDVGDLWSRAVAEVDRDRLPRRLVLGVAVPGR